MADLAFAGSLCTEISTDLIGHLRADYSGGEPLNNWFHRRIWILSSGTLGIVEGQEDFVNYFLTPRVSQSFS
jgi:hypothetical protein